MDRKMSLGVGLAVTGLVFAIYGQTCPKVTDVRVAAPNDPDASAAEKSARWMSAAVVIGVSVIARDATVFVMGGSTIVGLSWLHRHANICDPTAGGAMAVPSARNVHTDGAPGYTPGG